MNDYTQLHKLHHDDYGEAVGHIHTMLGSIKDIEVFGRQVLVAVYVRPVKMNGVYQTKRAQMEDVWQGKAVLVLKLGPDAFQGDDSYVAATFGAGGAPQTGDWLFASQQSGFPVSLSGDGAERVRASDFRGDPVDIYDWDGWPCRIVPDTDFIGRITKPHSIV